MDVEKIMTHQHGGNLKKLARENQLDGRALLDFSANINPLGMPQLFRQLILENIDQIETYPDYTYDELKSQLSTFYQINKESIVLGNGAEELIRNIMSILPDDIVIIEPTFSEYRLVADSYHKNILPFVLEESDDFAYKEEVFFDFIRNHFSHQIDDIHGEFQGTVFLCNPNNPTGHLIDKQSIERLLNFLKEYRLLLILDESFIEFVDDGYSLTLLNHQQFDHLIILRSLTKFYAIPGLRLGFCHITNDNLKQALDKRQGTWNINTFAALCGEALPQLDEYRKESMEYYQMEKDKLLTSLSKYSSIQVYPSSANFIFIKVAGIDLYERLLEQGIVIRKCHNFVGLDKYYYRIAVRTKAENNELVEALDNVMKTYEP